VNQYAIPPLLTAVNGLRLANRALIWSGESKLPAAPTEIVPAASITAATMPLAVIGKPLAETDWGSDRKTPKLSISHPGDRSTRSV
jgi:hypothetical protein